MRTRHSISLCCVLLLILLPAMAAQAQSVAIVFDALAPLAGGFSAEFDYFTGQAGFSLGFGAASLALEGETLRLVMFGLGGRWFPLSPDGEGRGLCLGGGAGLASLSDGIDSVSGTYLSANVGWRFLLGSEGGSRGFVIDLGGSLASLSFGGYTASAPGLGLGLGYQF